MNKITKKELLGIIIANIVIALFFVFIILYGTSDKCWYANMHDKNCEVTLNDDSECKCYQRFIEKNRK